MNGRTCQLCGKPLSRFTVGSGGDFCSREHRNQFRLRAGMDRLLEANKVASLMRRRENAKVIPPSQLVRDSKVLPRVAPAMRVPARAASLKLPGPPTPQLEILRISAVSGSFMTPRQNGTSIRGAGRSFEASSSFGGRKLRPVLLPRSEHRFPASIVPAGPVLPQRARGRAPEDVHKLADLGYSLRRTHLGGNGIHLRSVRALAMERPAASEARRLNNSADRGRELRVSGGIGFRLPVRRLRTVPFTAPGVHPPVPSTQFEQIAAIRAGKTVDVTLAAIRLSIREVLGPKLAWKNGTIQFRFPGVLANGSGRPRETNSTQRTCDLVWGTPPPTLPEFRHRNGAVHFRPAEAPQPFPSTLKPREMQSTRRLTLVAFEPRETPFEMPPTALHGTLLSGMPFGASPVRQVEQAPTVLEEHFDAGLQNWVGGTADWKVDIAGVRPGSLALYSPSLEFRDYQMEFLTRIENRSVTWLFRAADLNNYFQATLAVSPEGGYEFRRSAVINGVAETPIVHPISVAPTGKTAVTLRTRTVGQEFTVSLDGRVIDTWKDSRLAAGGVGFVAAPEDRVRLYWVKVSPAGHLSKEHLKQ